jgi:hypothetical protein
MTTYEENANAFQGIFNEVDLEMDLSFTEADTRVKLIDRILHEALGWSESGPYMRREEHVHDGYIDYTLQAGGNFMLIEAKRVGKTFSLPLSFQYEKHLTVKNLIKQSDIQLMYDQVTRYAHERGVPSCVLTNGAQWIVFLGVRTDNIHIRNSRIIVFNGLSSINSRFLDFWSLLSFESVQNGSLQKLLGPPPRTIEPSFIFNSEGRINIPYDRNPLSLPLVDVLPRYFGDLHGDPSQTDMLEECFVLDDPVQDTFAELGAEAGDEKPSSRLTMLAPVMHFYSVPLVAQKLNALLESFLSDRRTKYLQVLLGRVGIGKTTFLKYFFDIHKRQLKEDHFVLYLDFRDVSESTDLEEFFSLSMWDMLTKHPRFSELTSPTTLKLIFRDELGVLERGPLHNIKKNNPELFDEEISRFLGRQLTDRPLFLRRIAEFLYENPSARFVLIFDNVDQLDIFDLQEKVIRFAWAKATAYRAFLILSMWEETYFSSKRSGRVLSTMRTVPLQIARQSITSVVVKRLQYLIRQINSGGERLTLLDEAICDKETFCKFIDLIMRSLLVDNKRVRMFLELAALGNIRAALETFNAFLTAGSLETVKILESMRKNQEYLVPVHEFVKCVMLGSKRYYSESTSEVVNLFAIGDIEAPSHFTRLRILQWLYERRHESTAYGLGFRTLDEMIAYFNSIGVSKKDVTTSARKLIEGALVENEIRARKQLDEAQSVRLTPAGRYYLTHLYRQFPYIDLVMQDTPFFDREYFQQIAPLCETTEMTLRFERCEKFLDYLQDQEEEELVTIEKLDSDKTWRRRFVPNMRTTYEATKQFIIRKGHGAEAILEEEPLEIA